MRVVVDCGNGVPGGFAPALYRRLGCEVYELYCEVDGTFPNHHPDPSHPENLEDLIQALKSAVSSAMPHLKDDPQTVDKAIADCKEILDVVMEGNVKEWLS